MDACAPDLANYVALLTKQRYLTFSNTPKGLVKAYQEATKGDGTTLEKVFLDAGGFSAWFQYFLTNRAVKSTEHFEGQAADQQLLVSLHACSSERQQEVAVQASLAIPAINQKKFNDVLEKTINPSLQKNAMTVAPRKRRRPADDTGPAPASPVGPTTSANSPRASPELLQDSSRFVVVNPPILRATAMFPTYLAGAIQKFQQGPGDPWLAAITMSFLDVSSFGNKLGSMMSLGIMGNKVERLANLLFGACIESTEGHRYLALPSGLRVIPSPDLVLRGCNRDVLVDVFGKVVADAIKESPAFKEEADQGNPLTECVTMTISCRVDQGAVMNLSLADRDGYQIKAKLYD